MPPIRFDLDPITELKSIAMVSHKSSQENTVEEKLTGKAKAKPFTGHMHMAPVMNVNQGTVSERTVSSKKKKLKNSRTE